MERIVAHAQEHEQCGDCGAGPGQPCVRPGPGRSVCKARFVAAAIVVRRQDKAARLTSEQTEILAGLPRVTAEEIEAAKTQRGGWTRATLARWNVPWPPPGWRQALLRGENGADER